MSDFPLVCNAFETKGVYTPSSPENEAADKVSCCEALGKITPTERGFLAAYIIIHEMLVYFQEKPQAIPNDKQDKVKIEGKKDTLRKHVYKQGMDVVKDSIQGKSEYQPVLAVLNEMLRYFQEEPAQIPNSKDFQITIAGTTRPLRKQLYKLGLDVVKEAILVERSGSLVSPSNVMDQATLQKIRVIMETENKTLPQAVASLLSAAKTATPEFCSPPLPVPTIDEIDPSTIIANGLPQVLHIRGENLELVSQVIIRESGKEVPIVQLDLGVLQENKVIRRPFTLTPVKGDFDSRKNYHVIFKDEDQKQIGKPLTLTLSEPEKGPRPGWVREMAKRSTAKVGVKGEKQGGDYTGEVSAGGRAETRFPLIDDYLDLQPWAGGEYKEGTQSRKVRADLGSKLPITALNNITNGWLPEIELEAELNYFYYRTDYNLSTPNAHELYFTYGGKIPVRIGGANGPVVLAPLFYGQYEHFQHAPETLGFEFSGRRRMFEMGFQADWDKKLPQWLERITLGTTFTTGKRETPTPDGSFDRNIAGYRVYMQTHFDLPVLDQLFVDWKSLENGTEPIEHLIAGVKILEDSITLTSGFLRGDPLWDNNSIAQPRQRLTEPGSYATPVYEDQRNPFVRVELNKIPGVNMPRWLKGFSAAYQGQYPQKGPNNHTVELWWDPSHLWRTEEETN